MSREILSQCAYRSRWFLADLCALRDRLRSNASVTEVSAIYRELGGITYVSLLTGIPLGTLSAWGTRNRIPATKVLKFEEATGVSRYRLRPDVFGPAEKAS